MVDKILEFQGNTFKEIRNFQDEIIETRNSRLMFLFAYYVTGADIKLIGEELLKLEDVKYLHYYIRTFKEIDYDIFVDKIISITQDAGTLFNVAYDTEKLPDHCILKILLAMKELDSNYFITKLMYNYFNVQKRSNLEIFEEYKKYLLKIEENNLVLNLQNIRTHLEDKIKHNSNAHITNLEGFSKNHFDGRDGQVPDIIAYHITNDYNKALKHFNNPNSYVSCHFIIDVDGTSKQIINLKDGAWANGTGNNPDNDLYYKLSTHPLVKNRATNANNYTISIEHISYDGSLTEEQYAESLRITNQIIEFIKIEYDYDIPIDSIHLIGHNQIHPILRPKCPGINFPLNRLINDLRPEKSLENAMKI